MGVFLENTGIPRPAWHRNTQEQIIDGIWKFATSGGEEYSPPQSMGDLLRVCLKNVVLLLAPKLLFVHLFSASFSTQTACYEFVAWAFLNLWTATSLFNKTTVYKGVLTDKRYTKGCN